MSSIGTDASGMTMDDVGVVTQTKDLELVFKNVSSLPIVDHDKMAAMGFSLGAVPAAFIAIKEDNFLA